MSDNQDSFAGLPTSTVLVDGPEGISRPSASHTTCMSLREGDAFPHMSRASGRLLAEVGPKSGLEG